MTGRASRRTGRRRHIDGSSEANSSTNCKFARAFLRTTGSSEISLGGSSMQSGTFLKSVVVFSMLAVFAAIGGCNKKVTSTPPAQTPVAPTTQPTVTLNASPTTVNPGATVTLSWTSTDATDLSIDPGVGKVATQGSTPVTPTESTTFTITATGAGGTATANVRVTVTGGNASVTAPTRTTPAGIAQLF